MLQITDQQFEQLIGDAMDELPQEYIKSMNNVAITWENEPTPEQHVKLKLRLNETLLGLYEGRPLTERYSGYSSITPDKITIFKNPILHSVDNMAALKEQVKHTLWHEIAHHFGLNHERIHTLEKKPHKS